MPGGLLNLIAQGDQNIILTGNPTKSFFKATYCKYTNFGLQKFRIDYDGSRILRFNEQSDFVFKVPRYAELLMDTYLVVTLPNIWSPIIPPQDCNGMWLPYDFKWIENLGLLMIKEISLTVGGQTIQKFSGQYLLNKVKRDWPEDKKELLDEMIGNLPEFNDPANYNTNNGYYPNAYHTEANHGAEPSIRGKNLYIPLNTWFSLNSKFAFPLVSLQYNELYINVSMRPTKELYQIRNVTFQKAKSHSTYLKTPNILEHESITPATCIPYIAPSPDIEEHKIYRFLQTPPSKDLCLYTDKRMEWNADVHLVATYCFLSEQETHIFAEKSQAYLIQESHEYIFKNVTGSQKVRLESLGLIASWMIFFQRSDINLRNEWSNYSNWKYDTKPQPSFFPLQNIDTDNIPPLHQTHPTLSWCDLYNTAQNFDTNNIKPLEIITDCSTGNAKRINNYTETEEELEVCPNESSIKYLYPGYRLEKITNAASLNIPQPVGENIQTVPGEKLPHWQVSYGYDPMKITGNFNALNQKNILLNLAIILDGKYRENLLEAGIYENIEKYASTISGSKSRGLYCYNFGLNASYLDPTSFFRQVQPSGAINLSKFFNIELEFNTYIPPFDPYAQTAVIKDLDGQVIGINKPVWNVYEYNYDMTVLEERFNILQFMSGNCGLKYTR